MAQKIQIRRDTENDWILKNPILSDGELGFEKNSGNLKIGDGVNSWINLKYKVFNIKGDAFTYSMFTPEQLALLKGDAFTYSMFTPEQLALLKGSAFTYADFTPAQLLGLRGNDFHYSDFTTSQLNALKVKGDPFLYSDFTPQQLLALKGAAGLSVTNTQINTLGHLIVTFSDASTIDAGIDMTRSLSINFLVLIPYVYNVPIAMKFTTQINEKTPATLSIPLNTNMPQFTKLTITPTQIGLVILNGIII